MKSQLLFASLMTILMGCAGSNTYMIFAENARDDNDARTKITLRMPVDRTPDGTLIFCSANKALSFAKKLSDRKLIIRYTDGKTNEVELLRTGEHIGQVTYWPTDNGRAARCGIDPSSPEHAFAYFMWGEFTLFLEKTTQNIQTIWVGDDKRLASFPMLTGEDRRWLADHSVPSEILNLLP